MANTLSSLGHLYFVMEDYGHAIELYGEAFSIRHAIGDVGDIQELMRLADVQRAAGRIDEAARCYEQALVIVHERRQPSVEVQILRALGLIFLSTKQRKREQECYERLLSLVHENEHREWEAETLLRLSELQVLKRNFAEAMTLREQALAIPGASNFLVVQRHHALVRRGLYRAIFATAVVLIVIAALIW